MHGRYTVVRKLAEGGMAEIFLARQHGSEGFEKTVVLKRIHSAFNADEQLRNMLIDEAHISMTLHHNNVVQVLDLGRAGGRLFLVLELVDGWDLQRVLERAGMMGQGMPPGLALHVMTEVCRALSYAHGRTGDDGKPLGIIHRDVSPENVLLSEQGEVKLADFGIAKAMSKAMGKRERTATGVIKGKLAFMSPEQALARPLDVRSDVFSFGTMLYAVATGVRPFEAKTDYEVFARVQRAIYTAPEVVKPDLPPSLVAVIKRTMALEPDQRYQTAEELLVDLEEIWRVEFGAPGQTELKLWLAELARLDGALPIGRATTPTGSFEGGSGDLGEGDALVLGDDDSPDEGVISYSDLPNPEMTGRFDARSTAASDVSLPVVEEHGSTEMIERLEARGRRRTATTAFVLSALIGGGVAAGIWYNSTREAQPPSEAAAAEGAGGAAGAAGVADAARAPGLAGGAVPPPGGRPGDHDRRRTAPAPGDRRPAPAAAAAARPGVFQPGRPVPPPIQPGPMPAPPAPAPAPPPVATPPPAAPTEPVAPPPVAPVQDPQPPAPQDPQPTPAPQDPPPTTPPQQPAPAPQDPAPAPAEGAGGTAGPQTEKRPLAPDDPMPPSFEAEESTEVVEVAPDAAPSSR